MTGSPIRALMPKGPGHQFVFYGDSCSGVPGALHAARFASVNAVVQRLDPGPDFIVFPGDEVIGLVPDETALRRQWAHFNDVEMAWLDRTRTPIFHSTGNHTVYDRMSERVFAEVMSHLPRNGPPGQGGLSYFVRDGDLLQVFVNTLWSGLSGEGHVELAWLEQTLRDHADAGFKFVIGHHPAFAVNGYVGPYQRTIGPEYVEAFWDLLTAADVTAYLCSHILAFDVQCHRGVLQITSAGAGTAHRMPEEIEYLHCVQIAVDGTGLRYQVLDETGALREGLSWPPGQPARFDPLTSGPNPCGWTGKDPLPVMLRVSGRVEGDSLRQTILSALDPDGFCPFWMGLVGPRRQVTITLQPQAGRSPHQWFGPCFANGDEFELDILVHPDMGPSGFLWRGSGRETWTGMTGASAWGVERLVWPDRLFVGAQGPADDATRFAGSSLRVYAGVA